MAKWERYVDQPGEKDHLEPNETEVWHLKLGLLMLEASRENGKKLWEFELVDPHGELIEGHSFFEEDLARGQIQLMLKAIRLLEADGKVLAEAMKETAEDLGLNIPES